MLSFENATTRKVAKYGVISGRHFPVFRLVNLRIQSEYRKMRTRNNSVIGHISHNVCRIVHYYYRKKGIGEKLIICSISRLPQPAVNCSKSTMETM